VRFLDLDLAGPLDSASSKHRCARADALGASIAEEER
jgi:hypothetical protein